SCAGMERRRRSSRIRASPSHIYSRINSCRFIFASNRRLRPRASSTPPAGTRLSAPLTCATSPLLRWRVLPGPGLRGKSTVITGPEAFTYADAADKLSSAIGRKVTYVDTPLEGATQAMLDDGAPAWLAEGQAEQFRFRWQGKQSRVTSTIADIARKSPATFE